MCHKNDIKWLSLLVLDKAAEGAAPFESVEHWYSEFIFDESLFGFEDNELIFFNKLEPCPDLFHIVNVDLGFCLFGLGAGHSRLRNE